MPPICDFIRLFCKNVNCLNLQTLTMHQSIILQECVNSLHRWVLERTYFQGTVLIITIFFHLSPTSSLLQPLHGGGPRIVVSTVAFHARVRGSVPGPRVKLSIVGSLRDRVVACSASDRQGSNFESCVWRTVLSHSSHHPQKVLLVQFSLYVHKGGLKPYSFHFISSTTSRELRQQFAAWSR